MPVLKLLDFHKSMLSDKERLYKFEQAIAKRVSNGDTVLDIGCGTGILSYYALKHGAKKVYAIDKGNIIELAKQLFKEAKLDKKTVFINQLSNISNLPEKVDLIISETIGNFGIDEGILDTIIDSRKRHLKSNGKIIPQSLDLYLVPLEADIEYKTITSWNDLPTKLNYEIINKYTTNNIHWLDLKPEYYVSKPFIINKIDLSTTNLNSLTIDTEFKISRNCKIHGLGGWFSAELAENIKISNTPPNKADSWCNVFFPLEEPLNTKKNDTLFIKLRANQNGSLWSWDVKRNIDTYKGLESYGQSTFFGRIISENEIEKKSDNYRPNTSKDFEIDKYIINLIDGIKSVEEITEQVNCNYHDSFNHTNEISEKVKNLIIKLDL